MRSSIIGQEVVYFARCLVGMCRKVPVAPKSGDVICVCLSDVTRWMTCVQWISGVQWNTTQTICAIECANISHLRTINVCSIPQCFANSTQEMKLNRSKHCLPRHLLWSNRLNNDLLHRWDLFALHSKNNHCTKRSVYQTFYFVITARIPWLLQLK
jgi:hypothetical protein